MKLKKCNRHTVTPYDTPFLLQNLLSLGSRMATTIGQTPTLTSTTKVVLEAQWGICPAPCVLRQYKVVVA